MRSACVILMFMILKCYGQDYHDMELTKFPKKTGIKLSVITITCDTSASTETYYSYIYKDKIGNSTLECILNSSGDTTSVYKPILRNDFIHETIWKRDTNISYHKSIYNKNYLLQEEIHDRNGSRLDDTSKYFYNKKNQLIKCKSYRSYGILKDTLIYKDDILHIVLHYEDETIIPDTTRYFYDKKGNMTKFYTTRYLRPEYLTEFIYNDAGLCTTEIYKYRWTKNVFENTRTYHFTYHPNKNRKAIYGNFYHDGEMIWEYNSTLDEHGFTLESYQQFFKTKGGIRKKYQITFY